MTATKRSDGVDAGIANVAVMSVNDKIDSSVKKNNDDRKFERPTAVKVTSFVAATAVNGF